MFGCSVVEEHCLLHLNKTNNSDRSPNMKRIRTRSSHVSDRDKESPTRVSAFWRPREGRATSRPTSDKTYAPGADRATTDEVHAHICSWLLVAAGGSFRFGRQRSLDLGMFEAGGRHLRRISAIKKKIFVCTKYTCKKSPFQDLWAIINLT